MGLWAKKKAASRPPEGPTAADLNDDEREWLDLQRGGMGFFLEAAGVGLPDDSIDARLRACDDLIRWWHTLPADDRPDANDIVNVVGVAFGDVLAAELDLEWKIITDAFGTDLGLWWSNPGNSEARIVLSPTHTVARRFGDGANGFLAAAAPAMIRDVRAMKAGNFPG